MPDHPISETYSCQGTWWVPGAQGRRVAGQFRWEERSTCLELHEPLEKLELSEDPSERFPVVHGLSVHGERITVFNALTASPSFTFNQDGIARPQKLSALHAAVGEHLDDQSELTILSARVPGIQHWLARQWYTTEVEQADDVTQVTFVAKYPKPHEIEIPGGKILLSLDVLPASTRQGGFSLSSMGRIAVKPDAPQRFDWLLEHFARVVSLLSIMAGCPISTDCITVVPAGSQQEVSILVRLRNADVCPLHDENDFFLVEKTLGIPLADALSTWYTRFESVKLPSKLAVDVLNATGNSHTDFLAVMQALEGFHRGVFGGLYMKPEEFETARAKVAGSVPMEIQRDHRHSFLKRIEHGNEYSLRRRMKELVRELPENVQLKVVGRKGDLPGSWVDSRNAYTHWFSDGLEKVIDGAELHGAIQRLRMLLRVSYLRMVGIPDQQIEVALTGRSKVAWRLKFLPRT